jgi:RNA polymerase sigma-70 factor (sigma-E family)
MVEDRDGAFTEWAQRTAQQLRGTAYLLCGDWHTADDVVQDALVRVYERWHRIRPEAATSYARRVVATSAVDRSRKPWRREVPSDVLPDRPSGPHDDGPDYDVVSALAELPSRQRAVLVLRFFDDLSVDDTARVLGITPGTVKSSTSRGLDRLRELMRTPVLAGLDEEKP